MDKATPEFLAFLRQGIAHGGFGTDDVLAAILPLFEQINARHEQGLVAPLDGPSAIGFIDEKLQITGAEFESPRKNIAQVETLQKSAKATFEIVAESGRSHQVDAGTMDQIDLQIAQPREPITRPVYLPGYVAWEYRVDHHDQLTDIFSLGMILASCSCHLDFTKAEDLHQFVSHRSNLFTVRRIRLGAGRHGGKGGPALRSARTGRVRQAEYIAQLVRQLLGSQTGLSLAVVAFSEAQQSEIEDALNRLGGEDPSFQNRLAAEYEREEDGQFCGLIVKNLENVQGDERDIVILSVCYGPDRDRRTLMNFGPINQRGGEKRLNVIFSRAKRHMAVVSSIRHSDITNDYNDGANCLKNFLEYAAAFSRGDLVTAQRALNSSFSRIPAVEKDAEDNVMLDQLAARLESAGFVVGRNVGQSSFRLPLAVRRSGSESYELAILIDDESHYQQANLLERYYLRPAVLESFGWKVAMVFCKDWLEDAESIIRQIEAALAGASGSLSWSSGSEV